MKKMLVFLMIAVAAVFIFSGCQKEDESVVLNDATNDEFVAGTLKSGETAPPVVISTVTLFAGQTINVGTVTISQVDGTPTDGEYDALNVSYVLTGGWVFKNGSPEQVKFYLGSTKPANDNPGNFPYKYTVGLNVTSFSVDIPFSDLKYDGCTPLKLNVMAHADVQNGDGTQTQTAWGNGEKFEASGWSMFYTVDLMDKTPPTASNVTTTVECIGDVPEIDPEVVTDEADNCGLADVPVTFLSEVSDGKSCPETIIRTYLVTDAAGNTTTVAHTIVVDDATPPVLTAVGKDIPMTCELVFTPPTVTDNCDPSPVITYTDKVTGNTTVRTWVATDACGNVSSEVTQSITLDKEPPVLSLSDVPDNVACSVLDPFLSSFPVLIITDNFDLDFTADQIVVTDVSYPVNVAKTIWWFVRTWTVTDDCGNVATISKTIIRSCEDIPPVYVSGGTAWAYSEGVAITFNELFKKGNNWGWSNKYPSLKPYILYVGAGQNDLEKGMPVGEVTIELIGANYVVTYTVVPTFLITEAHLWIGTTPLPVDKKGNYVSSPGLLGYVAYPKTNTCTFMVPNTFGENQIYTAVHAVVEEK